MLSNACLRARENNQNIPPVCCASLQVDFDSLCAKIKEHYPTRRQPEDTPALRDFVRLCMRQAPEDRPTCAELLQHEFITKHLGKVDLKRWLRASGLVPSSRSADASPGGAAGLSPHTASPLGASPLAPASSSGSPKPMALLQVPAADGMGSQEVSPLSSPCEEKAD